MFRQRRQIIPLLALVALIFCMHNVYQSLHGAVTSSHAYFERESAEGASHWHGHVNEYFNASEFGEFRELSHNKHRQDKDKKQANSVDGRMFQEDQVRRPPDPPPYTKLVHGRFLPVPLWQRRLAERLKLSKAGEDLVIDDLDHKYLLVELLQVRLYDEDKARWTLAELKQWMHFMFLAGVEHIYVCDHYKNKTEMLERHLERYIERGLVTYLEWGAISHPLTAQIHCYQHIINHHKHESIWQIAVDMDEYPFSLNDTKEDFLIRILQQLPPYVTEVSMTNYLMLGQGDRNRTMVLDRIDRMTPREANMLVKPVYRPERVQANVHHNHLIMGKRVVAPPHILKMLHYWGARVQDWGPDTPNTLAITVPMTSMRDAWTEQVRNSLLVFGEFEAFSSTTGP